MPAENTTVAVYGDPVDAEAAVRELLASGFDSSAVSVAGRESGSEESAVCYRKDAGVRYWGRAGRFWNAMWDLLPGWALLTVPGAGAVLVAGPLADWVVTGLENSAIFTGLSGLGAALHSIGISRDGIAEHEAALAAGKCLVIAHGPAGEVARAKRVLLANGIGAGL